MTDFGRSKVSRTFPLNELVRPQSSFSLPFYPCLNMFTEPSSLRRAAPMARKPSYRSENRRTRGRPFVFLLLLPSTLPPTLSYVSCFHEACELALLSKGTEPRYLCRRPRGRPRCDTWRNASGKKNRAAISRPRLFHPAGFILLKALCHVVERWRRRRKERAQNLVSCREGATGRGARRAKGHDRRGARA